LDGTGKLGASGKALPGWEIKAVDDNGNELPTNQPGEIIVRGPIMEGYYNNPQATNETIKDGWLHTGDIGRIDEDGYLFLSGRKKNIIILKGQNIYPSDVEEVLCAHPKVAGAIVVGIPDRLRGEIVGAAIRLKEGEVATEQEIRQFCQERMADYKLPRKIIFADSLANLEFLRGNRNESHGIDNRKNEE
jgi:long-chain acyl-CoA synthetase